MILTDKECEERWVAANAKNPIALGTEEGDQVFKWFCRPKSKASQAPMGIARQAFVSPVDGSIIRGADDLSAHEREHNIIQVGDEYVGVVNRKREEQQQLKSDMGRRVREAEKNGMSPNDNFNWQ